MKRIYVSLMVLAGFVVSSALFARVKELTVVLKWNANDKQPMPAFDTTGGLHPRATAVAPNGRDRGKQICENTEHKDAVPVYTSSDVPAYVREHVARQLKTIGLDVSSTDEGARVLRSQLIEFWVAEGNRYRGSVRLKVTVTDPDGKELWSA